MNSVQSQFLKEDQILGTYRDDLESEDFVGKVSKFEFLAHNSTSPVSSADKQRWAVFEGLRFPSRTSPTDASKGVTGKPPQVPLPSKSKQGPPTPPKPSLYNNLSTPPFKSSNYQATSYQSTASTSKMEESASSAFAVHSSQQEEISPKKEVELQEQCQKMREARLEDQETEHQERLRLQEILNMCADYERQLQMEKQQIVQQQPNKQPYTGIKTNGSLPRDTPPISCSHSSSDSTSPLPDSANRHFLRSTSSDDETFVSQSYVGDGGGRSDTLPVSIRPGIRTVATNHKTIEVTDLKSKNDILKTNSLDRQNFSASSLKSQYSCDENSVLLSLNRSQGAREPSKKEQLKHLKVMKSGTETLISKLREEIKEFENQESEILAEYEMEKALLEGEQQTQLSDIMDDENRLEEIKLREYELLNDSSENHSMTNEDLIDHSKKQIEILQRNLEETSYRLRQCEKEGLDVEEKERLKKFTIRTHENIEAEKKIFEDLEFQKLEHEAHHEEEREAVQHRLSIERDIIRERLKLKRIQLDEIEMQQSSIIELVRTDAASVESKRQDLLEKSRKERLKYVNILKRINELVQSNKIEESGESSNDFSSSDEANNDENLSRKLAELKICDVSRSKSSKMADDILISKVVLGTSFSPTDSKSRTSATLQEVERNRKNILDQQGSRVLEEERNRVQKLKQKVSDEVRSQWEENRRQQNEKNRDSVQSIESDGAYSLTSSEMPTDTPSSGDENTNASSSNILITTPEIHHYDNCKDMMNANWCNSLPRDNNSNAGRNANEVVLRREKLRSQRPLTRYLPIRANNFNLKLHIESAGHQLDVCCDNIAITTNACRGYLHKLSNKFRSWKKRWFVFDRNRRALMYYRDKNESKARRVMYFQDIEEVYVDHQSRVKSPNPGTIFCMKTTERLFFIMAPTPEIMRVWVDVIFTGAEGYQEFMLDMEL